MIEKLKINKHRLLAAFLGFTFSITGLFVLTTGSVSAAACVPPSTDYGNVTAQITIPVTNTYRIWSRMKAADATNNSYDFEIDGTTCVHIGNNASISSASWNWIGYRDGVTTTHADITNLTAGVHNIKLIGTEPGVMLDRIILDTVTSSGGTDTTCIPDNTPTTHTGLPDTYGDNCLTSSDTQAPQVTFAFPGHAAGETLVPGTGGANDHITIRSLTQTVVTPTLTDNVGVTSSAFKVNGTTVTLTTGNYTFANANGDYNFNVTASDAATNVLNKTITVKQRNPNVDRDGAGKVNIFDVLSITGSGRWNQTGPAYDLNDDGTVNIFDILMLTAPGTWNP